MIPIPRLPGVHYSPPFVVSYASLNGGVTLMLAESEGHRAVVNLLVAK